MTPDGIPRLDDILPVPDDVKIALDHGWLETQDIIIVNNPDKLHGEMRIVKIKELNN